MKSGKDRTQLIMFVSVHIESEVIFTCKLVGQDHV